jgi:signal transduction histidine kinase/ligand-binding sensor domain-containing protein
LNKQRANYRSLLLCSVIGLASLRPIHASLDPTKPLTAYTYENWQNGQGLPQNSVLSIAQTANGYLWLGTEEGLVRFDGLHFTVFDVRTAGLRSETVTAVLADDPQDLWIGTNGGGLSHLHEGKFTTYTTREGLSNNSILCLFRDRRGVLWIGTDGGGLASFHQGQFRTYTKADGLPNNVVFSISQGAGGLWIGTDSGLIEFSAGRFRKTGLVEQFASKHIRVTHVDRQGNLWIGTNGDGLYRVSFPGSIVRFTTAEGLGSNSLYSIYEDRLGTLWLGTAGGGLDRYVNGTITGLDRAANQKGSDVWSILEDKEGNLWTGTGGGGLNCFKNRSFTTLSKADGLTASEMLSIMEDNEGSLWIGSNQGLMRWREGRVTTYTQRDGLPDDLVLSLSKGADGGLWIGTRRGLAQWKNSRITSIGAKDGYERAGEPVVCTLVDHLGNLWLGTRGGLTRFDGQKFYTYTTHDGLSNNFVLSIYEDKQGVLWVGTQGGGVNRFKNQEFTAFTSHNGLSNDVVWTIAGDNDGTLWLGTNGGGLNRFRDGHFTSYTTAKGFYDDSIFAILDDGQGRLWFTCNRGIFSVSRKQLNDLSDNLTSRITPTVYGTADGLLNQECNGGFQPAAWRLRDGRLAFPTMEGVGLVDPAHLPGSEISVSAVVERVLIDQKEFSSRHSPIAPPGRGQLEIQFTAPTFTHAENVQFSYMLEGFDKEWTFAGTRRTAYYTNIPHGQYRFRVRSGMGEKWSDAGADLFITLEPHYYQTVPFYVLIGILSLSLVAGAYKSRVNQLKQREEKLLMLVNERTSALQESERLVRKSRDELELRVQERTIDLVRANQALEAEISVRRQTERQLVIAKNAAEAASKAKSHFLANMSHEIRTPINGILGMTEIALSTELKQEQREYLDIVKASAETLIGVVDDIMDFSNLDSQNLALRTALFPVRNLVREAIDSVRARAEQKNLRLTTEIAPSVTEEVIGDPLRLRQILVNLLDNAVKFTDAGSIRLSVGVEDPRTGSHLLHFAVADNGIGIPLDRQQSIFEPFTQGDSSSTRRYGGAGLGLSICSRLATLMGGRLWLESTPGMGSTFHFTANCPVSEEQTRPARVDPQPVETA